MAPHDPHLELEEDYASEEDSDFAPEDAPANEVSSDDENDENDNEAVDGEKPVPGKRKRPAPANPEAEDIGFENSGDEAIVEKGKKRQKKSKSKHVAANADDEDGEDRILIKTRSMRAVE